MTREERFGRRLRELRAQRGWTQRRAATEVGISHMRLGELEIGRTHGTDRPTRPSRDTVKKLARAYGVPTDSLLELAGHAPERSLPDEEASFLLDVYQSLDEDRRRIALRLVQTLADVPPPPYKAAPNQPDADR